MVHMHTLSVLEIAGHWRPISTFGQIYCTFSMGQSNTYKMSDVQGKGPTHF